MVAARRRFALGLLPVALFLIFSSRALSAPQILDDRSATVTVNLRLPNGVPFDRGGVVVNLCAFGGAPLGIGSTRGGQGQVVFGGLPPGRYSVEVFASGYEKVSEPAQITLAGERIQVYVTLAPDAAPAVAPQPAGPPILAPSAQKELSKAMEAFRSNKPEDARKHLDKLARVAPANPDVNYIWGLYYVQRQDWANAKIYWEKAVQIYPRHSFALAGLGQLAVQAGNLPAAIGYLARAVDASPSSWNFHERLAEAYLMHREYGSAQKHAERAIELGKDRATRAQLILADALLHQNEPKAAQKALNALVAEQPSGPLAEQARHLLKVLSQPPPAASATSSSLAPPVVVATRPIDPPIVSVADLVPPSKWMPPNVDDSVPPVEPNVACPLRQIQQETGKRVRQFVDAVNRITATESLEHEVIDRHGLSSSRQSRTYAYVASLQENRSHMITVEEYRNGTRALDLFPGNLATLGLPSLVLIFHPDYRDEYDVTCEGLSRWHGGLAWQVHFRQKPDKPSQLQAYSVGREVYPVALRGRAWIAVDTFQVVSLETDIVAPIRQVHLNAEHISVEYMPVKFHRYNQSLWLPESAELFFDFGGRRIHRRHHFTNYLLFSVDENQKIADPAAAGDDPTPQAATPNDR